MEDDPKRQDSEDFATWLADESQDPKAEEESQEDMIPSYEAYEFEE